VDDVPVTTRLAVRCGVLPFSLMMFGAAVRPSVQVPEFELPDNVSHDGLSFETELVHVDGDSAFACRLHEGDRLAGTPRSRIHVVALAVPPLMWPCDCGPPKPACAYLAADAIFLGRVSFTNDDGSGRFTQATLVRFDVEEHFKGIAADVRQVWVDPGSFTSCYENYKLGGRYLVFARKAQSTNDSAAMTVMRGGSGWDPILTPNVPPSI
jgi:hypothetical protein